MSPHAANSKLSPNRQRQVDKAVELGALQQPDLLRKGGGAAHDTNSQSKRNVPKQPTERYVSSIRGETHQTTTPVHDRPTSAHTAWWLEDQHVNNHQRCYEELDRGFVTLADARTELNHLGRTDVAYPNQETSLEGDLTATGSWIGQSQGLQCVADERAVDVQKEIRKA